MIKFPTRWANLRFLWTYEANMKTTNMWGGWRIISTNRTLMISKSWKHLDRDIFSMRGIIQHWFQGDVFVILLHAINLGLYSLSGQMSFPQISLSLEAGRLEVLMIVSLSNSTGISACRGTCQISERLEKSKTEARGFESSLDLMVRHLTT